MAITASRMLMQKKWELEIVLPETEGGMSYKNIESTVEPNMHDNQIVFNSKASTTEIVLKYE